MEDTRIIYTSALLFLIFIIKLLIKRNKTPLNLPPSPPSLPFIGHLHLLKDPVHQTLQKLSQKHGPIISLKFGVRPVVLVSSSSAAEECFSKNDVIFANRPLLLIGKHLAYNFNTVASAPYGEHWRNLRKTVFLEALSSSRLSESARFRSDEIEQMTRKLKFDSSEEGGGFVKVEMKSVFRDLVFNVLMRMIAGKRYCNYGVAVDSKEAEQFTDVIAEVLKVADVSNPGDFLPVLRWIDYGGRVKSIKRLAKKTDEFLQGLIEEHRTKGEGEHRTEDEETMITRLISLQESDSGCYTDETIKGLVLVLLVAGTDTSSTTLEWAMSILLNDPKILDKIKSEIDIQIGKNCLVSESDLPRLPYLQSVISETMRIFPAAPLLLPHISSQDCKLGGFDVPRGTMLLVNAWAIHCDSTMWEEPTVFRPERFQTAGIDLYKFLPFGAGRRGCPGATLANRMMGLALASLIQCFDWKRTSDEEIDMTEGQGLNMPRAHPLEAMYKGRPILNNVI